MVRALASGPAVRETPHPDHTGELAAQQPNSEAIWGSTPAEVRITFYPGQSSRSTEKCGPRRGGSCKKMQTRAILKDHLRSSAAVRFLPYRSTPTAKFNA